MPFTAASDRLLLYAITDRRTLPGGETGLDSFLERAVAAKIDMIQIREKDLGDAELLVLTRRAVEIAKGGGTSVLVNDRLDIALAAGADGVHLGGHSAPISAVRAAAPPGFLIGASTHNIAEVEAAEAGGADFITFGPVFFTPSKARYGPPVGVGPLQETCLRKKLPVFALGGINEGNISELLKTGLAGLAAISLFQRAEDLNCLVERIRKKVGGRR